MIDLKFTATFTNPALAVNDSDSSITAETLNVVFGKAFKGDPGPAPVITGTKVGKVTTLSADGTPIATINDGEDGATYDVTVANGRLTFGQHTGVTVSNNRLIIS